jgi:hypothetical protein
MNIRETFTYFKFLRADPVTNVAGILTESNTGVTVDRQGYDSLTFIVNLTDTSTAAVPGTSYWYVRMEHADVSAAGTIGAYEVCGSIDMIRAASGAVTSGIVPIVASTYSGVPMILGYRGNKQFVRLNISTVGSMIAGSTHATILSMKGHAENWPVTVPNLDA